MNFRKSLRAILIIGLYILVCLAIFDLATYFWPQPIERILLFLALLLFLVVGVPIAAFASYKIPWNPKPVVAILIVIMLIAYIYTAPGDTKAAAVLEADRLLATEKASQFVEHLDTELEIESQNVDTIGFDDVTNVRHVQTTYKLQEPRPIVLEKLTAKLNLKGGWCVGGWSGNVSFTCTQNGHKYPRNTVFLSEDRLYITLQHREKGFGCGFDELIPGVDDRYLPTPTVARPHRIVPPHEEINIIDTAPDIPYDDKYEYIIKRDGKTIHLQVYVGEDYKDYLQAGDKLVGFSRFLTLKEGEK